MILVDSSVWIDRFANRDTTQTRTVAAAIGAERSILIGDLILTEVLQGTRGEREFARLHAIMTAFDRFTIVDDRVAVEAARKYQVLRSLGITPRKTIDTLIATRCIVDDIPLLYSDRDFDPFVQHLGLRSALAPGVN